jgi:hypothetical protein
MNFPLDAYLICNDTYDGPGAVRFDFKELRFQPTFYSFDNSEKSFARVLDTLKRKGVFERGIYKWYDKYYGPVIIDKIEKRDFVQIEGEQLLEQIFNLVDNICDQYFDGDYALIDRQLIKDKIAFSLRLIPTDVSIIFKYNVKVESSNLGSDKVVEQNLFCYFHFLIGYNQEKLYLFTLFFE